MSETPFPFDRPDYSPDRPFGSAPTLVKVAGILNLVMAGLDLLYGLMVVGSAIMLGVGMISEADFKEEFFHGMASPPSTRAVAVVIGFVAVLPVLAGVLKIVGGVKLLRRRPGTWGWGLATGIVGCLEMWCSYLCVLPLAIGVFTIVVCSLESTRRYLASPRTPG